MQIFEFLQFDWDATFVASACVGDFKSRLLLVAAGPLVLLSVLLILALLAAAANQRQLLLALSPRRLGGAALLTIVKDGIFLALPLTLVSCFVLVPNVARRIFASFNCDSFGFDDHDAGQHSYLHSDYSIRCSDSAYTSPHHEAIKLLAFAFIAIWPIGVPVLFGTILFLCRRAMRSQQPTKLSSAVQFITRECAHSSSMSDAYTRE
jgi:hypothetical protein|eukprot:5104547-Prymnesium_polylepis.1